MDQHLDPALARARQHDLRRQADAFRLAAAVRGPGAVGRLAAAAGRLVHRDDQPSPSRDL